MLQALAERGLYLQDRHGQPLQAGVAPDEAMQAMFARAQNEGRDLYEHEARALLRTHGVAVADELVAHTADERVHREPIERCYQALHDLLVTGP